MKRKRVGRRFNEASGKLQVDRFFEMLRKKYDIYAFQNESPARCDFFEATKYTYVITHQPKRDFFVSDNMLTDVGFEIEFYNITKEQFEEIEYEVKRHFGHLFFYKFVKNDTRKTDDKDKFSGKIKFKNFKRKEPDNNVTLV